MIKRLIALLLILTLIVSCCVFAQADDGEKKSGLFSYKIKGNGTAIITGFSWKDNGANDIYIPRMIDGYTVTEIGPYAFSSETDTSNFDKTIGSSVVVIIPDTITIIGEKAFFCTNITALTIPQTVQLIGSGAFAGCPNIKKHNVDPANSVYATIDGILYDKVKKELVSCPINYTNWKIPEGIVSIGDYAFAGCECNSVSHSFELPSSLEKIGKYAFFRVSAPKYNTKLDFDLKNVTIIDDYAFAEFAIECYWKAEKVKEIHDYAFEDVNMFYYVSYNTNKRYDTLTIFPSLESIGNYAFMDVWIRDDAFNMPYELYLVFPKSLSKIGEGAFQNFMAVYYQESSEGALILDFSNTKITSIPQYAFARCRVAGIVFPQIVESIGKYAFHKYESYLPSFPQYSLDQIPHSVKEIDTYAFSENKGHFLFEDKVFNGLSIGDYAFYNASYVPTLREGLVSIGEKAFWGVKNSTISVPASVVSIEDQFCDRASTTLEVAPGTYAAIYASENGYLIEGNEDTSWLNN